ncbi:MAG: erythromycin esterase family protein [Gammaproteobacteria bacterium]|nr:erythromycin esterase family protein [Gammaproteobacteria bacterium]
MPLYRRVFLPSLLVMMAAAFLVDVQRNLYSSDIPFIPVTAAQMALVKHAVIPLNNPDDNQSIVKLIHNKPLVLIGDSTHGTHEFYQQRINISKQLILKKNFKSILLEGDWPNVYTLNQYVQSLIPITAEQALQAGKSQGAWLWNNQETLKFLQWLRKHNQQLPEGEQKVSLYGLDIYSFTQSKQLVIDYLYDYSPQAVQQASHRYQCFARFNNDLHRYAKALKNNEALSCEAMVVEQYMDFTACRISCPDDNAVIDREAFFCAQQNALVVKNSEKNIRIQYMTGDDTMSWNERDQHMMESFMATAEHLNYPKTIIWAHNSHLGDARATEMLHKNQLNIGQLLRDNFGRAVFSIGMLTYSGKVMAADDWHSPARLKVLLNAHNNSNEALFHYLNIPYFLLNLQQSSELSQLLNRKRLQRHVGVIYRPQDEMASHYTYTHLAQQFDAIIFIDVTSAVTPITNK